MSNVETWDVNAAGNSDTPPHGWPEGMNRTDVNNCAREIMAGVATAYHAGAWLQHFSGDTVTKDSYNVVRIAGVDATNQAVVGRRVKLSGGATQYGTVASSSYSAPDTTVVVDVDPGLGTNELASGINLTFADAGPDTITAASGTPFSALVADDRVRIELSPLNRKTVRVASAAAALITLEASETLVNEGPIDARIFHEYGTITAGLNLILFHSAGATGTAAARNVGNEDGDIPTWGQLRPLVLDPSSEVDAGTLDGELPSTVKARPNTLINPAFERWREGTSFSAINDATYFCDQWKLLSDGNGAVDIARGVGVGETRASVEVTQAIADKKWALYQLLEARDSRQFRGQTVSLSFLAKSFVSPSSLRFGIFYTTAAEDAPASDPITAWPAAGADPTLAFGVLLGSVSSATGGTWTTKLLEGVVVPVSALNVGVLIWADDDTLALGLAVGYFAKVKLEVSSERTTYLAEPYSELVARTDRFWAKTFKEDVTPADYAAEYDGALRCLTSDNRSADPDQGFVQWQFSTPMHKPPTIATFNPDTAAPAAGADFARVGTVSDVLAVADDISEERCVLSMNADASNRRAYRIHATANARFF